MPETIRDILYRKAPEVAITTPAGLAKADGFIADAALEVNRSVWGAKADVATALLAAHMMTVASRGGTGQQGALIKKKVGPIEQGFAPPQWGDSLPAGYGATPYGVEYQRMAGTIDTGPILLGGNW